MLNSVLFGSVRFMFRPFNVSEFPVEIRRMEALKTTFFMESPLSQLSQSCRIGRRIVYKVIDFDDL